ncbi:hypothetical protein FA046_15730 [Pedobacter cryophilus]|uniref:Uncharacterized protein n=1 Tax=Pedobacter cryophilus TaxID=2571271 RepID=A0A4V5NYJ4_9SPHI|nr:hypothetical protein FA046_15730 [Pedobacter cryophilus]
MDNPRELPKRQHCPVCNRYVKPSTRYRIYPCEKCVKKAVDDKGHRVGFFNITLDGHGCQGKLLDSGKLTRSRICFIKDMSFEAEEAHFGGIVLRPIPKPNKRTVKKKDSY